MTRKFIGHPTRSNRGITLIRLPRWYSQFKLDLPGKLDALFHDLETVSNVILSDEAKEEVPYLLLFYCGDVAAEKSHPVAAKTKRQIEGLAKKAAKLREELERIDDADHLALYALLKHYATEQALIDRMPKELRELERCTSEILSEFELHTSGGDGVDKLPGFVSFVEHTGRVYSKLGGNVAANYSPNRTKSPSHSNPFVRFCWRLMEEVPQEARYSSSESSFGAAVKRVLKSKSNWRKQHRFIDH